MRRGEHSVYRVRVRDYRIVYEVRDKVPLIQGVINWNLRALTARHVEVWKPMSGTANFDEVLV